MVEDVDFDDDEGPDLLDSSDACPACGAYYTLTVTAPPLPGMLADHGSDAEIEAWEADHPYDINECTACGWRSDEEG